MTQKKHDELLSQDEVCRIFGITVGRLAVWRQKGWGPPFIKMSDTLRGAVRYRREDVEDFLLSQRRQTSSDQIAGGRPRRRRRQPVQSKPAVPGLR